MSTPEASVALQQASTLAERSEGTSQKVIANEGHTIWGESRKLPRFRNPLYDVGMSLAGHRERISKAVPLA